jgi:EAL domain-containing protein (putative c-di-GMP-specific phosphodiesterase class I)
VKRATARQVVERLARADVHARRSGAGGRELGLTEGDLASALAKGELLLHYQPIVDVRSGACRRAEALLRWQHPRIGQILPGEFLRLATSPELLGAIDLWVIRAALDQRRRWHEQAQRLGVSVNLSRYDMGQVDEIVKAIHRIESGALTFEIRSADASAVDPDTQLRLARLAASGARVTLDDVTLQDAPARALAASIDEIKIARSLVKRALVEAQARKDLESLVELARSYRFNVVAVGVEDQPTYELVAGLGCDMAQGHFVSRPLVPDRLRLARRWAAGLALTGAMTLSMHVAAGKAAGSGGRAIELSLPLDGLFSSGCCLDTPTSGDASQITSADRLEHLENRTGLPFSNRLAARADVFVERGLGASFAATLASKVDRDIADLEQEFGRTLEGRPTIYVFATRANFALGLQQVFGVRGPDAGVLAAANGGLALTGQGAIAINLQNVNARDLSVIRHELTHAMVHQIIGADGSIPTWLHEGIATLQENRRTGDDLATARSAATALSVLSAGDTTLSDLEPANQWVQRNAALGGKAYTVSAEAVRMVEQRVSHQGLVRILESVGGGESFGAAFASEAGESLGDFEHSFPARLAADQGGARILQAPEAAGVRWSFAGFAPNAPVTISIEGERYKLQFEVIADENGTYDALFGPTAPKGEYAFRASSRGVYAAATVRT